MSHTPGPWAVDCERNREGAYNDIGAPAQEWPDSKIGLVSCDNPNYRANCALIAAAPELLEALREMTDAMIDGEWGTPAHAKAERKARAAIDKATR